MKQSDTGLLIAVIILILFSALFSAIETAYSSASKIRLKNMANDKVPGASKALKILDNFDQFLTTVLIGNNIVNITMATVGTVLFTHIYGDAGATISTIVITVVVLIFGEVTPKSIAKQIPERFAIKTAGFVRFFEIIFVPLNLLFKGWRFLVQKAINLQPEDSDISDELITMVDEAEKDGDLEQHESDLISAAIEFNDEDVRDVLTPRVDVVAVDLGTPLEQVERVFRLNSYSRLPVYENSIDNIVGVIHEKDFYNLYYQDKERSRGILRKIIKPVIYTSENTKISALLKQLQAAKLHLAVVLDEYGGTQGIITMEDIIEELVGEIWDEHDTVKEYYEKVSDNTYLVQCDADIDDMLERFGVEPEEDEYDFITVSGWVIHELEHIPQIGDEFSYQNLHITVTKADQRKVIEIKVEINPKKEEDAEDD
ncbi:MAG: hemolysin family protein [Solobacterium sp.]|jgi:CBS domain containing-hemolysin-like protein|nr:hemolysin family protein [Solobacterium sp.]